MQQIADWLETLGMSEYAERFAESDIDTSVLRDLTDQDLLVAYFGVAARASAHEQQASLATHVSSSAPTPAR